MKNTDRGAALVYIGLPDSGGSDTKKMMLLPVPPEKIDYSVKNQNKTFTLVNGEERNQIRPQGLRTVTFERVLLPSKAYHFCHTNADGTVYSAVALMKLFQELKDTLKCCTLTINSSTDGLCNDGFASSGVYTLETYKAYREAGLNDDMEATLTFKEYIEYGTKIVEITEKDGKKVKDKENKRSKTKEQTSESTYTVKKGDTLWAISKKFYGDGAYYPYLAYLNNIKNANVIYEGQVLKIGPESEAKKYKGKSVSNSSGSSGSESKGGEGSGSGNEKYRSQETMVSLFSLSDTQKKKIETDLGKKVIEIPSGTLPSEAFKIANAAYNAGVG